ncbi:MAG: TlpA family protein disulfide reductase [Telmatospirillum sp.]|nr:TlpA family protein disulfide reductase [Telmatospirillum sp.]
MVRSSVVWALALIVAGLIPPGGAKGSEPRLTYIVPAAAESDDGEPERFKIPDLIFADGSGMPTHLAQFSGRVVILTFWSRTCGPCLKDLMLLNQIQGQFANLPFSVVALSEDSTGSIGQVKAFLSKQKYDYLKPYGDINSGLAQGMGVRQLPSSVIIDREGRVAQVIEGSYPWASTETVARLRQLIAVP